MALINPLLYLQFVPLWSHKVLQDIVQHGYQPVYQCGDNTWPATGNNRSNAAAGSEVKRGGGEGEGGRGRGRGRGGGGGGGRSPPGVHGDHGKCMDSLHSKEVSVLSHHGGFVQLVQMLEKKEKTYGDHGKFQCCSSC